MRCSVFVAGSVGLRFESLAGQIGHSMLPTARHLCVISSKGAALPRRSDAEMGSANSLHILQRV